MMREHTDDPVVVLLERTLAGRASGAVPSVDLAVAARDRRRRRIAVRSGVLAAAAFGAVAVVVVPDLIAGLQGQPLPVAGSHSVPTATPSGPAPSRIVQPGDCIDTGACAAGFTVDDVFYELGCRLVRDDLVSDDVFAVGQYDGAPAEVRTIIGADPQILVAVRVGADTCPGTGWRMVLSDREHDQETLRASICSAATTPDPIRESHECVDP